VAGLHRRAEFEATLRRVFGRVERFAVEAT
jgi:hypothetical protein